MDPLSSKANTHPLAKPVVILIALLLLLAPLFRAGNTPVASLMLQWLALAVLVASLWAPRALPLSRGETAFILLLALTPLLYLIPLPTTFIDALPGRDLYVAGLALLAPISDAASQTATDAVTQAAAPTSAAATDTVAPALKPLSITPQLTRAAGLALLVPLAVFIGSRALGARGLLLLAQLLLVIAVLEAILGLVQYGTAQSGDMILAVSGRSGNSAVGTYANRNHLAGLLAMTLPVTLALLYDSLGRERSASGSGHWRRRAAFLGSARGNAALLYAAAALILLVGVVFTRSRMGISMVILGVLLTTLLFARRIGGSNTFGVTGSVIAIALGFGIAIGLAPVLDRFSVAGLTEDGRVELFSAALLRIGQLFPVGTGPGTFPSAFPPVQPVGFGALFPNHAHNDYLEWIMDAGIVAVVLIVLALILYLRQWTRVYSRNEWTRSRFLQAGAGIGLLLIALHELVDYNLAIPANQAYFALLAGLFFMPPERLETAGERRRQRRTPDLDQPAAASRPQAQGRKAGEADSAPTVNTISGAAPPPDQIENPFKA